MHVLSLEQKLENTEERLSALRKKKENLDKEINSLEQKKLKLRKAQEESPVEPTNVPRSHSF